ncbi:MAG TPA: polyhydroxyalkanoate synthesis regulator DNA-binding domain-containing protein [Kofleriaceae bacterium]|nr:polyhydroxyalkanoate synthesis regulator DNA-binding domain-containing protein [Kofleriaceae bacterium]
MSEGRVIKRYANRKLYDTQHSRYVTLDQIAEMIRGGDDVKIIDNKTKEDLTSVTLAQIIFEEEKRQKSFLPLQAMRNIIQSGGESITQLVNQAKGRVSQILPRKKDEEPPPDGAAPAEEEPALGASAAEEEGDGVDAEGGTRVREGLRNLREFRDFLSHSQRTIDEWQKKMDGRIRGMVEGISPFSTLQKDIGALTSRIAQLEEKLTQLGVDERDD